MLTGLLIVVPLWVTWIVFAYVLELLARFGNPLADWLARRFLTVDSHSIVFALIPWLQWTLAIAITVLGLYLLGTAASFVIGHRAIAWFHGTLARLPFVKTVYSAAKRFVDVMHVKPEEEQRVVLIDFPKPGMKAIGLITRIMVARDTGEELASVCVPTTLNPTSGCLLIVPRQKLIPTDMSFDEAMTFVLTLGIVGPDDFAERTADKRQSR